MNEIHLNNNFFFFHKIYFSVLKFFKDKIYLNIRKLIILDIFFIKDI